MQHHANYALPTLPKPTLHMLSTRKPLFPSPRLASPACCNSHILTRLVRPSPRLHYPRLVQARVAPVPASDDPDASAAGGMSDADARAAAEVRARAAHWKRQREALLARKAEERARQLAEHERVSQ